MSLRLALPGPSKIDLYLPIRKSQLLFEVLGYFLLPQDSTYLDSCVHVKSRSETGALSPKNGADTTLCHELSDSPTSLTIFAKR